MKHQYGDFIVNTRDDSRYKQDLSVINCVLKTDTYRTNRIAQYLPIPKVIIDVGGHIGAFAMKAKSLWKDVAIIAFEPNLKNAELYKQNVVENNFQNVKIYTEAVSYELDKTVLTDHNMATGAGFMCTEERVSTLVQGDCFIVRTKVKLITLEEIMKRENIQHIDLLKIDCEGSEREIFRQMNSETAEKIGAIIGEYHIDGGYSNFETLFYSKFKHLKLIRLNLKNTTNIGEFIAVPENIFSARPDMIEWINRR